MLPRVPPTPPSNVAAATPFSHPTSTAGQLATPLAPEEAGKADAVELEGARPGQGAHDSQGGNLDVSPQLTQEETEQKERQRLKKLEARLKKSRPSL